MHRGVHSSSIFPQSLKEDKRIDMKSNPIRSHVARNRFRHLDANSIVSGPRDVAFLPISQPRRPDPPMSNGTPTPTPTPTPSFHLSYISFPPTSFCATRNDSTSAGGSMKNCDLSSETTCPSLETALLGREMTIWLLASWATSQLAVPESTSGASSVGNSPRIALGLNVKEDEDPVTSFTAVFRLISEHSGGS